ncbi:MAG: flagellar basal-body MS-ring/collar protein FliF, partial [Bacilli bacterium]
QVFVEPPDPENAASLSPQLQDDIRNILASIVSTTVAKDEVTGKDLTDDEIAKRVYVSAAPFNGKAEPTPTSVFATIPMWIYFVIGGLALAFIGALVFAFTRGRKQASDAVEDVNVSELGSTPREIPDIPIGVDDDASVKRKQLEKLAKENPTEFAKLLRTWLAEE